MSNDHRYTPWYDDPNPDRVVRRGVSRAAVWTIVIVIFFALVGAGVWAFKVATSDIKGKGDSVQIKNTAPNRIAAQREFNRRYQDIIATDGKITLYAAAVKADPKDTVARTNLDGTTAYCLSAVGEYNSLAREYTSADFRDADLPQQIDPLDTRTDCKGDVK